MIKKLKTIAKIALLSLLFTGLMGANALAAQKTVNKNERINVFIGFHQAPGLPEQALVRGFDGEIKYNYNIVPVIAANVPETAIQKLLKNPKVAAVELDGTVYAVDAELDNAWGVKRIGSGIVHNGGNKGAGVKIGIIDSGVDYTHPDLKNVYVGGYDFVEKDDDPMDVYGHGTHVAGIACAEDNGFGVVGVAPECALYSLRVLNDDGVGSWSATVAAMEWAVTEGLRVVNLSLGSSQDPGSIVKTAFDNAEAAGVVIVAAGGNSGNPPGKGNNVIYPAKYASVIAVAATDSNNKRPSWSSTGEEIELAAPGVAILSTWNDDTSPHDPQPICLEDVCYYKHGSGTSMASPHVAGAAALVIAVGVVDTNNNGRINDEVRTIMNSTAEDLGSLGRDPQYGYGLVAAAAAVAAVVPPATGNIEGKITNEANVAIEGATVLVEGTSLSATTDTNGQYFLENVLAGDQQVTASAEGYYSQTNTVTVVEKETIIQNFILQAIPTYTISGTVTSNESFALEGAVVTIEETGQYVVTGSNGAYAIFDVAEGVYSIAASKEGYHSQTKTVIVNDDATVDFILEEIAEETMYVNNIIFAEKRYGPGGSFIDLMITVEVLRASDNQPVSGAKIEMKLEHAKSSWNFTGNTKSDGRVTFTLKRAYTGSYTATITALTHDIYIWDISKGVTSAQYNVE